LTNTERVHRAMDPPFPSLSKIERVYCDLPFQCYSKNNPQLQEHTYSNIVTMLHDI
jgi:hypothetical protein